jgi:signal transduction histidine kinase
VTTMLGAPVERTTDGIGHTRRPASSQGRARSGSVAHAAGSRTRAPGRGVGERASAAVLDERARIARELHDSVSQTLYAITLGATRARMLVERNDAADAQRIIDDVLQLATAGQSELRALLTDLRSDRLTSAGLTTALAKFAADARTRDGLDIRFQGTGNWRRAAVMTGRSGSGMARPVPVYAR